MTSDPTLRLSVVIPAFNEELRLPDTLAQSVAYLRARTYGSEILVVDDGSSDRTAEIARRHDSGPVPVRLLAHPDGLNHGKGASVRLGMLAAGGTHLLFMDADNSTTLEHVERFWPYFDKGYDVVIGSRALEDSVIPIRQARCKELAGRLGNWIIQTLSVPGIADTQAGFKMFTRKAAGIIFPRQKMARWGYDIELLAIAQAHGCLIAEAPITWRNAPGSKVTARSYLQVLGEVWRIRRNLRAGLYR